MTAAGHFLTKPVKKEVLFPAIERALLLMSALIPMSGLDPEEPKQYQCRGSSHVCRVD
jgi:hypothetical protein